MKWPWKKEKVEKVVKLEPISPYIAKVNSKHNIRISNLQAEYDKLYLRALTYEHNKDLRGDERGKLDRIIKRMAEIRYEIEIRSDLIRS